MADIGARVGLEGEAEFSRAIKNVSNSSKELASELKAVKASFDKSTSAQEKYAAAQPVLQKQINNAQEKVDLLRQKLAAQKVEMDKAGQAVEEATAKYGANSKEVAEAQAKYDEWGDAVSKTQTDLNKAGAELNKASTELKNLKNASDKAEEAQNDLGEEVEDTGKEMEETKGKTSTFGDVLKANLTSQAIVAGIQAIAGAVKEVAQAVVEATKETVQWADDLATLSTVSGISTGELQKMEYMANLVDVDVDTITGSMTKLTNNMQTASSGTGAMADSFASLGVSVTDANGNLRDNQEVFYEVIDALGKVENSTERDALAMDIFGKSAQDLNPLIAAGADTLKELGDEAVETGYVLSDEALGGMLEVSDAFDRIDKAGEAAKRNAIAAIAPALASMAQQALPIMQTFGQNFSQMLSGDMTVGDFVTWIMGQITNLTTWITDNIPTIMAIGTQIIVAILNGLAEGDIAGQAMELVSSLQQGLADNLPAIIEAGVTLIVSLVEGLTSPESLTNLIQSGINLLLSLVQGLIGAIPQLVAAIPTIISNLITALIENIPLLITSGIDLIGGLITGLIEAIPDIIAAIPEIISAIIEAFKGADWAEIGTNIMEGLKSGLKNMVDSIAETARNIAGTILNAAKNVLGIHSPSRVFRDQVGKMIPAGLEQGVDKAMPSAIKDMESQMDNLVIGASATLNGINGVTPVGSSVSNNYGGFVINVNAQDGQSANDIANEVMYRIQNAVNRREAVFA